MGIGTVFTVLEWAAALVLAEITVSCLVRAASARWGFPVRAGVRAADYALLLPNITGSVFLAALAALGIAPLLTALSAAALFAVAALPFMNTIRLGVKHGKTTAWREAAEVLGHLTRTAGSFLAEDLRALAGLRRGNAGTKPADPGAAPGPVIGRPRRVPSTARVDPAVGPALVPEQVAAQLEAARVAIPSCYAAVAEWEASFEPEDGDDWRQHIAERAAGILTVAEVVGEQAEDLATGVKLDPAVTASETDFADDFADTASAAARSIQVYDRVYDGVHEHTDNGGTLPENARNWFGAGGPEGDGRAA